VPSHDPEFASSLNAKFPFMGAKFLSPNTISLIHSIDQQVILNFKMLYIKEIFQKCHEATSDDNGITLKKF
jgi:hypothetical protein